MWVGSAPKIQNHFSLMQWKQSVKLIWNNKTLMAEKILFNFFAAVAYKWVIHMSPCGEPNPVQLFLIVSL